MKKIESGLNHLVVTRSAFCLRCWQHDKPVKNDRFIVFGTDSQEFQLKKAHQSGIKGFTPNLYVIQFPYKRNEEGRIYVTKTCLMHGCGIEIGERQQNGGFKFAIIETSEHWLTEPSVEALLKLWNGYTGYNLL